MEYAMAPVEVVESPVNEVEHAAAEQTDSKVGRSKPDDSVRGAANQSCSETFESIPGPWKRSLPALSSGPEIEPEEVAVGMTANASDDDVFDLNVGLTEIGGAQQDQLVTTTSATPAASEDPEEASKATKAHTKKRKQDGAPASGAKAAKKGAGGPGWSRLARELEWKANRNESGGLMHDSPRTRQRATQPSSRRAERQFSKKR